MQLCNSIISGIQYEKTIATGQRKSFKVSNAKICAWLLEGIPELEQTSHKRKKAVKFHTKHSKWCAYQNLVEMYNEVYTSLVECGISVKHDRVVW